MAARTTIRTIRRHIRWPAAVLAALLLLIYVANVPFYAGGPLGARAAWRMEHGRLRVTMQPTPRREGFWIAANSEGLRFAPDWWVNAADDWMVNLPLWPPLLLMAGAVAWGFTGRRFGAGQCSACGYERGQGTRCPECGQNAL